MARRKKELCTDAEFWGIANHIRNLCPPPARTSVKVERVARKLDEFESLGETHKNRSVFTVKIARDLTRQETEDTMIHEWAHVLSWRPYHPVDGDHDAVWGISFATVYRQFYGVK